MADIVSINSEILTEIRNKGVNGDRAKLYLLGLYFKLDVSDIPETVRTQVNALGIVEVEYRDNSSVYYTTKWKVPLFNEEKNEAFAWVEGFRQAFSRINPDRKGTKSAVTSRMKKFFAEHPEVRMEDVKAATEAYLTTVNDPQYLKSAHKFIYEGTGFARVSMLEQYLEKVKVTGTMDGRTSKMH